MSKLANAKNPTSLGSTALTSLKTRAKSIRTRAESLNISLSSTQSLELLAASEHDKSWNVMQARYQDGNATNESQPSSNESEHPSPNILLLAPPGYGKSVVCLSLALAYAHKGEKTLVIAGFGIHQRMEVHSNVEVYDISSWCAMPWYEVRDAYILVCKNFALSDKKILVLFFEGSLSRDSNATTLCLNTMAMTQLQHKYVNWAHVLLDELPLIYETSALNTFSKHYHTILSTQYINADHATALTSSTTFTRELRTRLYNPDEANAGMRVAHLIWNHTQGSNVKDLWFGLFEKLITAVLSTHQSWDKQTDPLASLMEYSALTKLQDLKENNRVIQSYLDCLIQQNNGTIDSTHHDRVWVYLRNAYHSSLFDRPWHCIEIGDMPPHEALKGLEIAYTPINRNTSLAWSLQWSSLEISLSAYVYQSINGLRKRYVDFTRCMKHDAILVNIHNKSI